MLENINEKKLLFIDIETVGLYENFMELGSRNPELGKLWNDIGCSYFRRHYPEDSDEDCEVLYKKYSSLLPEFGKIICISVGFINGEEEKIQSFCGGDEKKILTQLTQLLNKIKSLDFTLCGHNIKNFDLPYLGKRMLINGLSSLHLVTSVMGIPSPKEGDVTGENMHHSWYIGKKDDIVAYCEKDISSLIKIIKKIKSL